MSTYPDQNMEGDEASGSPTDALDVHIGERHMKCIQPTDVDPCNGRIFADTGGKGTKLKVVMQNIYSLGYIQGVCYFMNDP